MNASKKKEKKGSYGEEDSLNHLSVAEHDNPNQNSIQLNAFKGLALAFLSGICFSLCSVIVKYVNHILVHPAQLVLYRSTTTFILCFPEVVASRENPFGPGSKRLLLILRAIVGATNIFLNFMAFQYLPIGEAAVIIFSTPVLVTLMAKVFLNEKCGFVQSAIVIINVIEVLLITKVLQKFAFRAEGYTIENLIGLSTAFGSLFFHSVGHILVRKLKDVHYSINMFYCSWITIIENSIFTFSIGKFEWHYCGQEKWLMILLGILSYAAQGSLIVALQYEFAGPVSTLRATADIALSFVFQSTIFGNIPDITSIIGAMLVFFCLISISLRKLVLTLPNSSSLYKKLKWLTV